MTFQRSKLWLVDVRSLYSATRLLCHTSKEGWHLTSGGNFDVQAPFFLVIDQRKRNCEDFIIFNPFENQIPFCEDEKC